MPTKLQALEELLQKCLHCGMCLPVCPTYALTLDEKSSPRGRIRLMKSVEEGVLKITPDFVNEMYFCLDCQACQTICPAGVQYGVLVENSRNLISQNGKEHFWEKFFRQKILNVLASKSKLKRIANLLYLYQVSGLYEAVENSNILSLLSESLQQKHALLPKISEQFYSESVAEILSPNGQTKGRVAFLSGCIMDIAFTSVHHDVVSVLLINGFEVVIPKQQQCCGSLHAHNGDEATAKILARKNIDVFEQYEYDVLVLDSAGCGAFMKEYGRLLADDPIYASRAAKFSSKVTDITEFFDNVGFVSPENELNKRVTYHEACHLVHVQKIIQQPRNILQSIPGIELIELPESTWCCGSAGVYNILRYDDSMKILERKMKNLESTKADIVITANPGCHLQLQYGIKKSGLKMEVLHPISLLHRAYNKTIEKEKVY